MYTGGRRAGELRGWRGGKTESNRGRREREREKERAREREKERRGRGSFTGTLVKGEVWLKESTPTETNKILF